MTWKKLSSRRLDFWLRLGSPATMATLVSVLLFAMSDVAKCQSLALPADPVPAIQGSDQGVMLPQVPSLRPRMLTLGNQRMTLICGLPGDEEHRERLTGSIRILVEQASTILGIEQDKIRVLVGDSQMQTGLKGLVGSEIATKESIRALLTQRAQNSSDLNTEWLFVLGHGNLRGKSSFLNIEGPDIDQNEFSELWKAVTARIKVSWLTQPTSGFWIRALSQTGSVVISATDVGLEITGTEMPYALTDVLAGKSTHQKLEDIDGDGHVSLFDLYLATCLEVNGRFSAIDRVQTEHALLEDSGDGRGRELQRDYLPDAREGVLSIKGKAIPYGRDGGFARLLPLAGTPNLDSDDAEAEEAVDEAKKTERSQD